MLNFTKIKIIIIYFILFLLTSFASLNLFYDENPILKKKVNLEFDHTVKVIVHTIEIMLPEIKDNALSNLKKDRNNKV